MGQQHHLPLKRVSIFKILAQNPWTIKKTLGTTLTCPESPMTSTVLSDKISIVKKGINIQAPSTVKSFTAKTNKKEKKRTKTIKRSAY